LLALGVAAGFASGMLGIGGGLVAVPAVLYVPRLLGIGHYTMREAAALGMAVSFFASNSGVLVHKGLKHTDKRLVRLLTPALASGSLSGAFASRYLSHHVLEGIFGVFGTVAGLMLVFHDLPSGEDSTSGSLGFSRPLGISAAFLIGCVAGMLGLGGGFLMIPTMIWLLHIPTRRAIGSNLGIIALAAAAGLGGKVLSGQLRYGDAAVLVAGAGLGAQLGGRMSVVSGEKLLRRILGFILLAVSLRMWWAFWR